MANSAVLGILEFAAILGGCFGIYYVQAYSNSLIGLSYNGLWFILGILSNISGLFSIGFSYFEQPDEMEKAHFFLQYHYLLAWFTVIVGYPTLVTSFWIVYYPSYYAHIHVALSLIPVGAWMYRQNRTIVITTQIASGLAIVSHAYISYLAQNQWGLIGACIMIINVISLSMPTRYNLHGLTSREMFIIGLTSASYILSLAVEQMSKQPTQVKTIIPW